MIETSIEKKDICIYTCRKREKRDRGVYVCVERVSSVVGFGGYASMLEEENAIEVGLRHFHGCTRKEETEMIKCDRFLNYPSLPLAQRE